MLNRIFALHNSYLQLATMRVLLFFTLFMGLGLLTLFMAATMYTEWHWTLNCIFIACMVPWAVAGLVFLALTCAYALKFHHKKKALCQYTAGSGLVTAVFSFLLRHLIS